MKTPHTPGPWANERMSLGSSKDRRPGIVINGPDTGPLPIRICDMRTDQQKRRAEMEANARLIAAAPDLLDALLQIRAYPGLLRDIQGTTKGQPLLDFIASTITKVTQP